MPQAAAPLVAESLVAESFAMAAPEMFAASSTFVPAAGELAALGAMEGMGAAGLGGLSALGSEFGTEALFGGLGETVMPTLGEGITQGITQGFGGAGEAGINEAMVGAEQAQAVNSGFSQAELEAMQRGREIAQASSAAPPLEEVAGQGLKTSMMNAPPATGNAYELSNGITQSLKSPGLTTAQSALPNEYSLSQGLNYGSPISAANTTAAATNPLAKGFQTALDFAKDSPFSAASMGYSAMKLLGGDKKQEEAPAGYNGILSKYKMSPNFQGRQANPEDFQYTPKVYAEGGVTQATPNSQIPFPNSQYPGAYIPQGMYGSAAAAQPDNQNVVDGTQAPLFAEGGVASFRSGGRSDSLDPTGGGKIASDYYESMLRQQAQNMPSTKGDPGIYYDLDPDTRYLDPVSAAQIRMAKINKRSNVQAQNMKRPRGLGQINLSPPGAKAQEGDTTTDAAHGGIMQAHGYADGGVTGSGNLDLHIPLDLGGGGGGGGSGGSYGGGNAYPFQSNSGFTGYNNAPQVTQQTAQNMPTANQPTSGLGALQGKLIDSTMSDTFQGTGAFGGNPQQAISQLMGLLGGQKMAAGGMTSLGGYAAGGNPRLLKGPGDGMSDNIPATIAGKQPARLADGEFVIPADVVSHLGNGSTEAGAKVLHAMMTKVRKERTGNSKQGKQINPRKFVPT